MPYRLRQTPRPARVSLRAYMGELHGTYSLLAREGGRRFALGRIVAEGSRVSVPTAEIAAAQYLKGSCHRLDLFVRLLAIEEHMGLNDFGLGLYRRFIELKSAAQGKPAPTHTAAAFLELVESVRTRGFAAEAAVVVDRDKVLRHGMHRLACAVFFDVGRLPVSVDTRRLPRPDYTLERLRQLGLEEEEILAVTDAERRYAARWNSAAGDGSAAG